MTTSWPKAGSTTWRCSTLVDQMMAFFNDRTSVSNFVPQSAHALGGGNCLERYRFNHLISESACPRLTPRPAWRIIGSNIGFSENACFFNVRTSASNLFSQSGLGQGGRNCLEHYRFNHSISEPTWLHISPGLAWRTVGSNIGFPRGCQCLCFELCFTISPCPWRQDFLGTL